MKDDKQYCVNDGTLLVDEPRMARYQCRECYNNYNYDAVSKQKVKGPNFYETKKWLGSEYGKDNRLYRMGLSFIQLCITIGIMIGVTYEIATGILTEYHAGEVNQVVVNICIIGTLILIASGWIIAYYVTISPLKDWSSSYPVGLKYYLIFYLRMIGVFIIIFIFYCIINIITTILL